MEPGVVRLDPDRPFDEARGARVVARLGREDAEQVQGIGLEHYPTKLNHLTGMILRRG